LRLFAIGSLTTVDISIKHRVNLTNNRFVMHFTQGMYIGVFTGFALALWLFAGSIMYPPNTFPGLRSVKECPFYQQALANGTYDNQSAEILAKYDNGSIRNPYKPYTR